MASSRNPSERALAEALLNGADTGALIRAPDGRAPRILVGEGDPDMRDRLQRVLVSAGCVVETTNNVRSALTAAVRDPPDMVVADTDLSRPGEYSLLRRLRSAAATRRLPVIMLCGDRGGSAERVKREALAAGADDCLEKPFGARDLLSRVGLHLAMARVGHEASQVVRASEARLAEVLEAIGEAVYAMDRDERILFANRKALELWGKSAGEVIGRAILDVFPGIEQGEPYGVYRRVRETGEAAHLETTAPAMDNRWIGLDVHPAPNGGLVVAFRDIDERKRTEVRLRESEERFRLMLEALPDKAFVIRPDGIAEYFNRQLRDYLGTPIPTDPKGRLVLYLPEDRERAERARARGLANGEEFTIEARMRRDDGVHRWHRIRNRPVQIGGKIAFWLGTAVDIDDMLETNALLERRVAERTAELQAANRRLAAQIDEREKAEAQLRQAQRIEAVGQLTSGVAHDFNNLLTAIIGNLELLQARLDRDGPHARMLNGAMNAAERGARLTAQLLAFSRQQQLRPEPVDLNRIAGGLGPLLQSTLGATISIEMRLSPELWPALADASQVELVLLNLAINARDAMPTDGTGAGGTITITTANVTRGDPQQPEEPPPGDYATVSVADTGTGIPAAILDKVFDPFFTTKEVGKGSGLGLSQVLGVAQQLGGGVRIDTRPGAGTTVSVYLPRVHVRAAGRQRDDALPRAVIRDDQQRRHRVILLVDDDSDVRAVTSAMLDEAGYQVIEAGSSAAALECLEHQGGDVALMVADIAMPEMSGIDLASAVRRTRPDLPVVFVTGFAGAALPPTGTNPEEGSNRLLRKPFRATELAAAVAAALDESCAEARLLPLR